MCFFTLKSKFYILKLIFLKIKLRNINMSTTNTHTNTNDEYSNKYIVASDFMKELRKICDETDQNLSESLQLRINERKRVLYVNGNIWGEVFVSAMEEYLDKIKYVHGIHRKHYIFGVDCIQFSLDDENVDFDFPSSNDLNDCLIKCYRTYFKNASTYKKFTEDIQLRCKSIHENENMTKEELDKAWNEVNYIYMTEIY